jgi:hypothetical protein
MQIVLLILAEVVLPPEIGASAMRSATHVSTAVLACESAFALLCTACFGLALPWAQAGMKLRTIVAAVVVVEIVLAAGNAILHPAGRAASLEIGELAVPLVILAIFGAWLATVLHARRTPTEAIPLGFPLAGGVFVVTSGGGRALNHHWPSELQREALDIVALDDVGMRARGVLPNELARYAIYGVPVVAPCDGVISEARDGEPERAPGVLESDRPYGNYVVIRRADGIEISIAHLQTGSVRVREGEAVRTGDMLGRVGNSGRTTEPHLHIHADRDDETGVPMLFDGRYLVRNDVVRVGLRAKRLPPPRRTLADEAESAA